MTEVMTATDDPTAVVTKRGTMNSGGVSGRGGSGMHVRCGLGMNGNIVSGVMTGGAMMIGITAFAGSSSGPSVKNHCGLSRLDLYEMPTLSKYSSNQSIA
ncbi:MAG: hypothetical protein QOE70_3828 [Chthoniobacter sp.]|jgi:hypothetical protein|nr:hypothetical protein [Chthoniobacter sp.]